MLLLLLWLDEDELVGVVVVVVALDVAVAAADEQIGSTFGPGDGVYRKWLKKRNNTKENVTHQKDREREIQRKYYREKQNCRKGGRGQ